jgi:KDO2-lipid IV(A) lauroyltransferase
MRSTMHFFLRLLSATPLPILYAYSYLLYFVTFHVLRWHRSLAARNLANAFPEKSADERATILRRSYRHMADTLLEAIWGFGASGDELQRRVAFENPELIEHYVARKASVVILTAHVCNWEWMLLAAGARLNIPFDAVYKPIRLPSLDRFMREGRSRFGGNPIPFTSLLYELMRRASQARAYAMVADQTPVKSMPKHWTTFLHQDTAFFLGPERIARFLESPVIYVAMRRLRRGYYTVRLHVLAEPPYDFDDDAEFGASIAERYARVLEAEIRANPPDWLWVHNKWKYPKPTASATQAPGNSAR